MQLINEIEDHFINFISQNLGVGESNAGYLYSVIALIIIIGLGWLANLIVKRFLLGLVRSLIKKTKISLGEYLIGEKFFHRLSHLAPAFVVSSLSSVVFVGYPILNELVEIVINLYLVVIALRVIDSLINAVYKLAEKLRFLQSFP